ncbi:MAG: ROK family protein [Lawsonibacter sp.]
MYIGLDVGGTNLVAGLVDREGKILHKAACPVDRSWTAEELSARLARLARQAAEEAAARSLSSRRRGRGSPGLVDNREGVVVKTPNMPFRNTPLRALFQRELELPLYLGNDADCAPSESTGPARPGAVIRRWWSPWGPGSAAAWSGAASCTLASAARAWRRDTL